MCKSISLTSRMLFSSRFAIIPGALTGDPTEVSVSTEKGTLVGISAFFRGESVEPQATFVQLGIARSDNPLDPICLLASGYITMFSPVGWSGAFPLAPDTFIYCRAHGITTEEFQVGYSIDANR